MTRGSTAEYPPVSDLLPHSGTMVLLSRVLSHNDDETRCAVEVDEQRLFRRPDGDVPAWVGIEFMAQCVAAHAGLIARGRGEEPEVGFLLGSRRVRFCTASYASGRHLVAKARRAWGRSRGMVSFDCSLEAADTGEVLAEGRLSCYLPAAGDTGEGLR